MVNVINIHPKTLGINVTTAVIITGTGFGTSPGIVEFKRYSDDVSIGTLPFTIVTDDIKIQVNVESSMLSESLVLDRQYYFNIFGTNFNLSTNQLMIGRNCSQVTAEDVVLDTASQWTAPNLNRDVKKIGRDGDGYWWVIIDKASGSSLAVSDTPDDMPLSWTVKPGPGSECNMAIITSGLCAGLHFAFRVGAIYMYCFLKDRTDFLTLPPGLCWRNDRLQPTGGTGSIITGGTGTFGSMVICPIKYADADPELLFIALFQKTATISTRGLYAVGTFGNITGFNVETQVIINSTANSTHQFFVQQMEVLPFPGSTIHGFYNSRAWKLVWVGGLGFLIQLPDNSSPLGLPQPFTFGQTIVFGNTSGLQQCDIALQNDGQILYARTNGSNLELSRTSPSSLFPAITSYSFASLGVLSNPILAKNGEIIVTLGGGYKLLISTSHNMVYKLYNFLSGNYPINVKIRNDFLCSGGVSTRKFPFCPAGSLCFDEDFEEPLFPIKIDDLGIPTDNDLNVYQQGPQIGRDGLGYWYVVTVYQHLTDYVGYIHKSLTNADIPTGWESFKLFAPSGAPFGGISTYITMKVWNMLDGNDGIYIFFQCSSGELVLTMNVTQLTPGGDYDIADATKWWDRSAGSGPSYRYIVPTIPSLSANVPGIEIIKRGSALLYLIVAGNFSEDAKLYWGQIATDVGDSSAVLFPMSGSIAGYWKFDLMYWENTNELFLAYSDSGLQNEIVVYKMMVLIFPDSSPFVRLGTPDLPPQIFVNCPLANYKTVGQVLTIAVTQVLAFGFSIEGVEPRLTIADTDFVAEAIESSVRSFGVFSAPLYIAAVPKAKPLPTDGRWITNNLWMGSNVEINNDMGLLKNDAGTANWDGIGVEKYHPLIANSPYVPYVFRNASHYFGMGFPPTLGFPPVVNTVTPNSGRNDIAHSGVILGGQYFTGVTNVHLSGPEEHDVDSFTFDSDTQITVQIPSGIALGAYEVQVTTADGTNLTSLQDWTATAPPGGTPTVTSVSPSSGKYTVQHTPVTVGGTGFTGATSVKLRPTGGGSDIACVYVVGDDSTITLTVPVIGLVDTFYVIVTTLGGSNATSPTWSSTLPGAPTVTTLGTTTGKRSVAWPGIVVNGTNFLGATAVNLVGTLTYPVTFGSVTDTTMTIDIPADIAGDVYDIEVTAPGGTNVSSTDKWTATSPPAPTVTNITPNSGTEGAVHAGIIVAGTDFYNVTGILLFGTGGTFPVTVYVVNNQAQITLTVPIINQHGFYDLRITAEGGTNLTSVVKWDALHVGLSNVYGQHHYLGEWLSDAQATQFLRDQRWDTLENGAGDPQTGMQYFDNTLQVMKVFEAGYWTYLHAGGIDHGALTGLDHDDHTQYLLATGSRDVSGPMKGVDGSDDADLATKGYVDGVGSAHDQFTELTDAPPSYSGKANQLVKVKNGEDGVEFSERAKSGSGNPNGTVTGFFGQTYLDTATNIWYQCTSTPSGTVWRVM